MTKESRSYYLTIAHKYPDLTKEEEKELIKEAKDNNLQAFSKLILSYLKLVVKIAQKYYPQNLSLDDLIGEGITGLMEAIYKFDEKRNVRLATYAARRIRYRIRDALIREEIFYFPIKIQKLAKKIKKRYPEYLRQPEELAKRLKVNLKEVQRAVNYLNLTRFNLENKETSEENPLVTADIEDNLLKKFEIIKMVNECLSQLLEREQIIIKRIFGLPPYKEPDSLTKIGKDLGVSRERIRQIRNGALKKLQRLLNKRLALVSLFL